MNRIFGSTASKKPKPNLTDAINSVRSAPFSRMQRADAARIDGLKGLFYRSQGQEARCRAGQIQGPDEQTAAGSWAGASGNAYCTWWDAI